MSRVEQDLQHVLRVVGDSSDVLSVPQIAERLDWTPRRTRMAIAAARKAGHNITTSAGSVLLGNQPRDAETLVNAQKSRLKDRTTRDEIRRLTTQVDALMERQGLKDFIEADTYEAPAIELKSKSSNKSGTKPVATVGAILSDCHFAEYVWEENVNGFNAYDQDIAEARVEAYVTQVVEHVMHLSDRYTIPEFVLALLGDIMTGHIHEDLVESTSMGPMEESLWVYRKLVQVIDFFKLELGNLGINRIHIPAVFGNHGRNTKKKRSAATAAVTSFEWLIFQLLSDHYSEDDAIVLTPSLSPYVYVPIHGRILCCAHGDQGPQGSGGIGGIQIPINKWVNEMLGRKAAHLYILGHFHTWTNNLTAAEYGNWLINGSLIGHSHYSHAPGRYKYQPAAQGMFLWTEELGPVEAWPVILSPKSPPKHANKPKARGMPEGA